MMRVPTLHPLTLRGVAAWVVILALTGPRAIAQAPAIVPITSEPSHHLALTTDVVRVFDVTAAPHATTLIHRHDHDYLFVTLGDADIGSDRVGGPPARIVMKDGDVEFAAGGFAHSVTNNSDRPFHNITIELLRPSSAVTPCATACGPPSSCAAGDGCPSVTRTFTADQWVANTVRLQPGDRWTADADRAPRLVVVVSDADLALGGAYESTAGPHRPPGNLIWVPKAAGRQARGAPAPVTITNTGSGPAKLVLVEWGAR
jgi:quercetin dioxygenase-like cupin family protein